MLWSHYLDNSVSYKISWTWAPLVLGPGSFTYLNTEATALVLLKIPCLKFNVKCVIFNTSCMKYINDREFGQGKALKIIITFHVSVCSFNSNFVKPCFNSDRFYNS